VTVPSNGATIRWNDCSSVYRFTAAWAAATFAFAAFRLELAMLNADRRSSSCCWVTPPVPAKPV
jgi:hypothetical protein